jgi:hypothetical protein
MQSFERDHGRAERGPESDRRMSAAPRREYARRIDCAESDRRGAPADAGRGRGAPLLDGPRGGARRLD